MSPHTLDRLLSPNAEAGPSRLNLAATPAAARSGQPYYGNAAEPIIIGSDDDDGTPALSALQRRTLRLRRGLSPVLAAQVNVAGRLGAKTQATSMDFFGKAGDAGPSRPRATLLRQNTSKPRPQSKLEARGLKRTTSRPISTFVKPKPQTPLQKSGSKDEPIEIDSDPEPTSNAKVFPLQRIPKFSALQAGLRTPHSQFTRQVPQSLPPARNAIPVRSSANIIRPVAPSLPSTPAPAESGISLQAETPAEAQASPSKLSTPSVPPPRRNPSLAGVVGPSQSAQASPELRALAESLESPAKRGGGAFGSHKKKLDPSRSTIIGRTRSKEFIDGRPDSPFRSTDGSPFRAGTPHGSIASQKHPPSTGPSPSKGRPMLASRSSAIASVLDSGLRSSSATPKTASQTLPSGAAANAKSGSAMAAISARLTKTTPSRILDESSAKLTTRKNISTFQPALRPHQPPSSPSKLRIDHAEGSKDRVRKRRTHSLAALGTTTIPSKRSRLAVGAYTIPDLQDIEGNRTSESSFRARRRKNDTDAIHARKRHTNKPTETAHRSSGSASKAPSRPSKSTGSRPADVSPSKITPAADITASEAAQMSDTDKDEVQEAEEEYDLLAEWADFEFDAPEPTAIAVEALAGAEASRRPEATDGAAPENVPIMASEPDDSPSTPRKRRLSAPDDPDGPSASAKKRAMQHRLDELKGAKETMRQKALEDAMREQQKRLTQIEALQSESESEESDRGWGELFTRSTSQPPVEPEAKETKRRPGRQAAKSPLRKAKVPVTAEEPKPKDSYTLAILKRALRQEKKGLSSNETAAILARIRQKSTTKPTNPDQAISDDGQDSYPTPESVVPDEPEDIDMSSADVKKALKALPTGMVDDKLLKEIAGEDTEGEKPWTGFWSGEQVGAAETEAASISAPILKTRKRDIYGRMLADAVERNDLSAIATRLSRSSRCAAFLSVRGNSASLSYWLLQKALTPHSHTRRIAIQCLQMILLADGAHPFGDSETLLSLCITLIRRAGGSAVFCEADIEPHPLGEESRLGRDESCEIVCALARSAAENHRLESIDAETIGQILLGVATDDTTSTAMLDLVEETLPAIWSCAMVEILPAHLAHSLLVLVAEAELSVQTSSIMAVRIGCRVEAQRALSRWFAAGLLQKESLRGAGSAKTSVPTALALCDGADALAEELRKGEPDHAKISAQLVLLSESHSDINAMFEQSGEDLDPDIQELETILREADRKIVVRSFSKNQAHVNKTRLSQLYLNMTQMVALFRTRRSVLRKGKKQKTDGVQVGPGGQMKLSFGKAATQDGAESTGDSDA